MEALTRTRQKAGIGENTRTALDVVSTSSIAAMGAGSALIGLWAFASLISAMVSSGPLGLVRGYIQAVAGL
jgi:hypothetical protein